MLCRSELNGNGNGNADDTDADEDADADEDEVGRPTGDCDQRRSRRSRKFRGVEREMRWCVLSTSKYYYLLLASGATCV
jgi:hypothetical protein